MKEIKLHLSAKAVLVIIAVYYAVGVLLFILPFARNFFFMATPFTLLAMLTLIFVYHKTWGWKFVVSSLLVFALSIAIEALGVKTGQVFGEYAYLSTLGVKVAGVPLMIGLNWLILVYGANSLMQKITKNKVLVIIGAALAMVGYDLLLEIAAPTLKMWVFSAPFPPLKNFVAWFILSAFFQWMFTIFKIDTNQMIARGIFITQLIFFGILAIYLLMVGV